MRFGLITDTHGEVHPGVAAAFRGVERILHAGDVGSAEVLSRLEALAPVTAVCGNADPPDLAGRLPTTRIVVAGAVRLGVVHRALEDGMILPEVAEWAARERLDLVLFGHTHRAWCAPHAGTLYVNPGGGGRKRLTLVRGVAVLDIEGATVRGHIVPLDPGEPIAVAWPPARAGRAVP